MKLVCRNEEITVLTQLYCSKAPELLVLCGHLRSGKTCLVREFFATQKNTIFFEVAGVKNASMQKQIENFTAQLGKTFYGGISLLAGESWEAAFLVLAKAINDQVLKNKKVVLFFDELPWMATRRSRLLETLEQYWNQHWSRDNRIKLIVCGSAVSWISNKIISDRAGFHSCITREINLKPFNLAQTKQFLRQHKIKLTENQILQLYMITGGVLSYLTKVEKGLSVDQIIASFTSSKNKFFLDEFDELFASLFDSGRDYITIIKLLAKNPDGIGERKLLEQIGKQAVGAKGKKMLDDLEQAGFIMKLGTLYNKLKGTYYRLSDFYILFYLNWIESIKNKSTKKTFPTKYWQAIQITPEWRSWQDYAFKSVCYQHITNIKRALNLDSSAVPSSWRYLTHKGQKSREAQIDLLFDGNDNVITICEMKYNDEPFTLTKDYVDMIRHKIAVFKSRTHTKKEIEIAMIAANGVTNNYYADDLITNIVTLTDLFNE